MTTKQEAIDLLHREDCSCVILKDGAATICHAPGIADLLRLSSEQPELLNGAFVADKVVGKAAAALLILGKVAEVYTDLISEAAVELLRKSDVKFSFARCVEVIQNRAKDGLCPMEMICLDAQNAEECRSRIIEFIRKKS